MKLKTAVTATLALLKVRDEQRAEHGNAWPIISECWQARLEKTEREIGGNTIDALAYLLKPRLPVDPNGMPSRDADGEVWSVHKAALIGAAVDRMTALRKNAPS